MRTIRSTPRPHGTRICHCERSEAISHSEDRDCSVAALLAMTCVCTERQDERSVVSGSEVVRQLEADEVVVAEIVEDAVLLRLEEEPGVEAQPPVIAETPAGLDDQDVLRVAEVLDETGQQLRAGRVVPRQAQAEEHVVV